MSNFVKNMVSRCVIALAYATGKMQKLQVRLNANEVKDQIEHFQQYGFTSHPLPGAEGVALFLQGDRSNGVVICVDDRRYRLATLEQGEVAIYTDEGDSIILKRGNTIEMNTKSMVINSETFTVNSTSATINAQTMDCTGVISGKDVVAGGQKMHNHTHGNVESGPSRTGTPQ